MLQSLFYYGGAHICFDVWLANWTCYLWLVPCILMPEKGVHVVVPREELGER